ncbi:hypothetical protein F4779DRAFT_456431 [Xylariaceae sp. FL0662B]|nr:hypothetical protein F4779DRAFT_456431 [Xylariaceae sp. FL0662B]
MADNNPHSSRLLDSRKHRHILPSRPLSKARGSVKEKPAIRRRGKTKGITSCERCRNAHIKCVSNGAGVPCENCAKKSSRICSFTQSNADKKRVDSAAARADIHPPSPHSRHLKGLAAAVLAYMRMQQSKA